MRSIILVTETVVDMHNSHVLCLFTILLCTVRKLYCCKGAKLLLSRVVGIKNLN